MVDPALIVGVGLFGGIIVACCVFTWDHFIKEKKLVKKLLAKKESLLALKAQKESMLETIQITKEVENDKQRTGESGSEVPRPSESITTDYTGSTSTSSSAENIPNNGGRIKESKGEHNLSESEIKFSGGSRVQVSTDSKPSDAKPVAAVRSSNVRRIKII